MGNKRQWEIKKPICHYEYHLAAAAVWCALGLDNVRLLRSRVPEAIADGVLGLDVEVEGSLVLLRGTWKIK